MQHQIIDETAHHAHGCRVRGLQEPLDAGAAITSLQTKERLLMNYVEYPHLGGSNPRALLLLPRPHPRIPILVQTERRQTLVDFSQENCPKTATRPPGIAGSAAQVHEARGRQSWQSLHSHGHAVDTVTLLGTPISFPRLTRPTPKNIHPPPIPRDSNSGVRRVSTRHLWTIRRRPLLLPGMPRHWPQRQR